MFRYTIRQNTYTDADYERLIGLNLRREINWLKLDPQIDRSLEVKATKSPEQIQYEIPNLPVVFGRDMKPGQHRKNKTCAQMPMQVDIHYNNMYWQTFSSSNGSFYLYGAYFDNRTLVTPKPVVRLLGMIDRLPPVLKTVCQLWFKEFNEPIFSPVSEYKYMWIRGWGNFRQGVLQPYLITCPVPKKYRHLVPESVSLVEKPCDAATTNMRVTNNLPEDGVRKDFAICVKGLELSHSDLSVRLVEWIEVLRSLGAKKLFFYSFGLHPNVSKVLNFYQRRGIVDVTPLTLPAFQPGLTDFLARYFKAKLTNKRQNELIPYNDCFYRNINMYQYIVVLDIDEVIIPKGDLLFWKDIINNATLDDKEKNKTNIVRGSYSFRHVYFFDSYPSHEETNPSIPRYLHMLQHTRRSVNYTRPGDYIKSILNTDAVLTVFNHFPLSCIKDNCHIYSFDLRYAHLQHYRNDCVMELRKHCGKYREFSVIDEAIWRYKDPVIDRASQTLLRLGFFDQQLRLNRSLTTS